MRATLAVTWKELLVLLKDKAVLAVYFLMPLLFASLMGMAFGNAGAAAEETKISIPVLLVNQDTGTYGQMLADGLKQATVLEVKALDDATAADKQVAAGDAAAAVVIPADLSAKIDAGEPVQVTLIKDPTQQEAANIAVGITSQAMGEIGLVGELRYGIHAVTAQSPWYDQAPPEMVQAMEAQTLGVMWSQVQQMRSNPLISVAGEDVTGAEVEEEPWNPITFYVPGFTVAFAFFFVGSMASTLLAEKEVGTFRRLISSPIPRSAIIGGKMLAYMIIVFLQVIVIFTVGYALFKMPVGNSPLGLALLTVALALCAASMGMLLGALCKSSKQADSVGIILGFVLMGLGGTIFPFFRSDNFMATLSRLTPNAHALEGYMGLLSDNWTLVQVLPQVGILFLFAAVFFGLAVWRFRFE